MTQIQPDCVSSPCVKHPNRPVVVWAAGRFLFALNLETGKFEAHRLEHHREPIRSIDYCSEPDNADAKSDSIAGCWAVAGDDKQVTIVEDQTFIIRERFLLGKRPSVVRCVDGGRALVWADKFGELFKCRIPELRRVTRRVVLSVRRHLEQNRKDSHAAGLYHDILENFNVEESRTSDASETGSENRKVDSSLEDSAGSATTATTEDHDTDIRDGNSAVDSSRSFTEGLEVEDLFVPFAGHLSQVTALQISGDRKVLVSGDRDEKVRVGSLEHPFITAGFGLGHTEFITSLSCPKTISHLAASASGDHTIKLWDLSGGLAVDQDGCAELSSVKLAQLPSSIEFSELKRSFLVICEGLSGLLEVPLIQEMTDSGKVSWRFDEENLRTISLPSVPLAILPSAFTADQLQFICFSSLSQVASIVEFSSEPVFYWTDRDGRLHLPVSLLSGSPLFSAVSWAGLMTGDPIPATPLRWWKHNRMPNSLTDEERLRKRLKHDSSVCSAKSNNPLM